MSISFTTTHDALTAPLETIKALHGNRPPVPALGLVRLGVSDRDRVTIEGFDYQTAIVAGVPFSDNDGLPGSVMLNRLMLTHIVKSFAIGSTKAQLAQLPITVQEDGGSVTLSAAGYRFSMPISKDDDFPPLPPQETPDGVEVDRDVLLAAVTRLLVCAGSDQTLPMLTGIKLVSVSGGLEMAATDRFRLGMTFVPTSGSSHPKVDLLLPAKELVGIVRHMPPGDLLIGEGDNLVWVHGRSVSVSLRKLDVEFVKYKSLIPKNDGAGKTQHHDALVPRKELAVALKRAQVVIDRGHHARLRIAGNTITVTAGGDDEGRMESPAFPTTQDGEDLGVIAFNPEYVGPALASFATDQVAIRYSTSARPIMFAEPGHLDDERAFRTLVMPARLPG